MNNLLHRITLSLITWFFGDMHPTREELEADGFTRYERADQLFNN